MIDRRAMITGNKEPNQPLPPDAAQDHGLCGQGRGRGRIPGCRRPVKADADTAAFLPTRAGARLQTWPPGGAYGVSAIT
jgi:hypothetical protein